MGKVTAVLKAGSLARAMQKVTLQQNVRLSSSVRTLEMLKSKNVWTRKLTIEITRKPARRFRSISKKILKRLDLVINEEGKLLIRSRKIGEMSKGVWKRK